MTDRPGVDGATNVGARQDAAAGSIAHAFKPNIFAGERRYVLDGDSLIVVEGGAETRLPLADIARVRLYAVPAGTGAVLKRTVLRLRSGAKRVIQANSFERLGVSEDRAASYRQLVEALLQRTVRVNPQVEIFVGPSTPLWLLWLVALVGALLVLVATAAVAITGELPLSGAVYLLPIALLLPMCWRGVAAGRSRRADSARLPEDVFATQ